MKTTLVTSLVIALAWLPSGATAKESARYNGICDASAAVALDREYFVVADDERNTLVTYQRGKSAPVAFLQLAPFLGTAADKESDLEGAATIGQRVFWISSHGRNKNGKERDERHRFFATDIDASTAPPSLHPVATPYTGLLKDLLAADGLKTFKLDSAAKLAPEAEGGLNIEGLAATPDNKLLIGFRNPIPHGKALVVRLENPEGTLSGQAAILGQPMLLDLGGLGIRSIELVDSSYLIVAGPTGDKGDFALYRWSGVASEAPVRVKSIAFKSLRPEAMFQIPGSKKMLFLSDDGGVKTNGVACNDRDAAHKSFRSLVSTP